MRDLMLRSEIIGEVRQAMSEYLEQISEEYVSAKELSKRFSFFTADWLRRYGHLLSREHVEVVMPNGERRSTGWGYPVHKISRMVADGAFRELEYKQSQSAHK